MEWRHKDEKILSLLKREAEFAFMVQTSRHAAAIVFKNKVIAVGRNGLKTHPIMKKFGRNKHSIYLHAEMDAIVRTINLYGVDILSRCSLYVLRINKEGKVRSSCPCYGCSKAIDFFKIPTVYHT